MIDSTPTHEIKAVCQTCGHELVLQTRWVGSGQVGTQKAALQHEEENPGHKVRVTTRKLDVALLEAR